MFFSKIEKNLIAKANRYDFADGILNGSIPFSLFLNSNISFKG